MVEKKVTREGMLHSLTIDPGVAAGDQTLVFRKIAKSVAEILDADLVSVWTRNPKSKIFTCDEAFDKERGAHTAGEILNMSEFENFHQVLSKNRYLAVSNVMLNPNTRELTKFCWSPRNIKSSLIIPLRIQGEVNGMIRFDHTFSRKVWTQEEIDFSCQIANLVVITILNQITSNKGNELSAVNSTIYEMTHPLELKPLLAQILQYAVKTIMADSGIVFLTDDSKTELNSCCTYKILEETPDVKIAFGEGVVGNVAETGVNNYGKWPEVANILAEKELISSIVAAPIMIAEKRHGVLALINETPDCHFYEIDSTELQSFANLAALAIEQHVLKNQNDRLRHIHKNLRNIQTAASIHQTLPVQYILNQIEEVIGMNRSAIKIGGVKIENGIPIEIDVILEKLLEIEESHFQTTISVNDVFSMKTISAELKAIFKEMQIKSFLAEPFMVEEDCQGYLFVGSEEIYEWKNEEIQMVQMVMQHLKQIELQTRADHVLNTQNDKIKILNEVSRSLTELQEFPHVMGTIGRGAVLLMDAQDAAMYLCEDEVDSISMQYGEEVENQEKEQRENLKLLKFLFAQKEINILRDLVNQDLPDRFKQYLLDSGISMLMLVPMSYSGQSVGTIGIYFDRDREIDPFEIQLMKVYSDQASLALQNAWMYDQLEEGYLNIALSLARTVDQRETSRMDNSERVAQWARITARYLELKELDIQDIYWAALLQDIGKTEIPDDVLKKPGALTEVEWEMIEKHPAKGAALVEPLSRFKKISPIIRHSREHYNGKGYPDGLEGTDIPYGARILAVADAFGSMTEDRSYRKALTENEALNELQKLSGTQFDPQVVKAFLLSIGKSVGVEV
ncbi:MAG: GAF domain-containing protein [Anaerolineaceae bacterium]|nr:GAF domain-containing protein [Anaerolineaceae bacterium]